VIITSFAITAMIAAAAVAIRQECVASRITEVNGSPLAVACYFRLMTVVLITGGSSGIGLATVRRLAEAGDQVFYASRTPATAPLAGDVTHVPLDLADPRACEAAVRSVADSAGRLDVLINNAGTAVLAPLEEGGDAEAYRTFEVNVFGPMRLIRAALPVMRAQGAGRIINVTSVNDIAMAPFGGWYSASKAALASLSMVLGAELHGSGIFVTVVAPGLFVTGMSEQLPFSRVATDSRYAGAFEKLRAESAMELATAGDPDEVARALAECIAAAAPPARIVVGADGIAMDATVRNATAEDLASMLRDYVTSLT
jgi:NAD(P)-dependent dehydrogenase (short-subunit alcohol dehydrogenase family)